MNILLVSYLDNGGSLQQLCNALNKYTEHTARHLNFEQTWLEYDVDLKAKDYRNEELQELLKDSEFFIFSEMIPKRFMDLGFKLTRTNTIIRCFGGIARKGKEAYRARWIKDFTTFTSGGFDPTIHPYLGFVAYHIPNIYEFSEFPKVHKGNKIKICHAATNKELKSTQKVVDTLWELERDFGIETMIIHGVPWKETIKLKSECHITIDQFKLGTYASSAIESMYMGHTVVSRLSHFVRSMHPDIPIVQATEETLYDVIKKLLFDSNSIEVIGKQGHEYAMREHDAKTNIVKWVNLIDWVKTGFK
ncbi:MAG: hypothetical protein ABH833_04360 [Parcubacteria group bacterium]